MSLGFDVFESDNDYEKEGLTGQVSRYSSVEMNYPCYIVSMQDIQMCKLLALKGLVATPELLARQEIDTAINIYFQQGEQIAYFGKILPTQVKAFINVFEQDNIKGFISKDKEISGMYLYVLAN